MNLFDRFMQRMGVQPPTAPRPRPELTAVRQALDTVQQARRTEDFPQALDALNQAARLAVGSGEPTAQAVITLNRAEIYIAQGRWNEADELLHDAYRTARANGQHLHLAYMLDALGILHQARGDWDTARSHFEESLEIGRSLRASGAEGRALGHLAAVYLRESNASYAVHLLREALPKLNLTGDIDLSCAFVGLLGQALMQSGQETEGRQMLERALRLSQQLTYRRYERQWGLVLGDLALAEGRYPEAFDTYQAALALFPADMAVPDRVTGLCQASKTALVLRETAAAVEYARQAARLSEHLDDPALRASAQNAVGMALLAQEDHSAAVTHLRAAADTYAALGARGRDEITTLRNLATAYSESGDTAQAEATYQQASAAAEKLGAPLELAQTRRDLGLLLARGNDMVGAIREWTGALNIYSAEKQPAQMARLHCDIAAARRYLGQGQRAMRDYESALMVINELNGDWETRGLVLSNAANAYVDQGDIESAEAFFNESIAIARRIGNEAAETTRRGNYGWFLLAIGRPQQAIAALNYALQLSRALRLDLQAAIQTDNLGLAHDLLNNYPKALEYHQQAVELVRPLNNPHWEQIFRANQANTLIKLYDYKTAQPLIEGVLAHSRAVGDVELIGRGLLAYADLVLARGQPEPAGPLIEEAISLLRKADMRRLLAEAFALYAKYHVTMGDQRQGGIAWREAVKLFTMLHMPQAKQKPIWLDYPPDGDDTSV